MVQDVQRIERELMASRKVEFDALPQFLGSRRCNVRGIPDEWVRQFKNIEEMDEGKFGAQMDGAFSLDEQLLHCCTSRDA